MFTTYTKLLPSVVHVPILELKPFLDHLKYVYLRDGDILLVIIAKDLTSTQEKKLVKVLRDHKTIIGWTITDIKGISLSTCMHQTYKKNGSSPSRET